MKNSVKIFKNTFTILIFIMIFRVNIFANSYELSNIRNAKTILEYKELTSINEIDTVKFGSKKNKTFDWIVLDKNDDKALLFSNSIEFQYNFSLNAAKNNDEITWSNSELRKYLNTDYLDKNFTYDEKNLIISTEITTNLKNNIETTTDKLFLLSQEEVEHYFRWKGARRIKDNGNNKSTSWWLRDQGRNKTSTKIVDAYGDFGSNSAKYGNYNGVCIAMWVKCDAGISGSRDENKSIIDNNISNVNSDFRTQLSNARTISSFDENTTIDKISGVFYGSYPQNDASGNIKEPIEWIVLEKKDNEVLLLSKYVLDGKKYNESSEKVSWESCSLRNWLNSSFLNIAFNEIEKNNIIDTEIQYGWSANQGSVYDKVFLLDEKEIKKYFKQRNMDEPNKRLATAATNYAINSGKVQVYSHSGWYLGCCDYWLLEKTKYLENPGLYKTVSFVRRTGAIPKDSTVGVAHDKFGVRPAIWVKY